MLTDNNLTIKEAMELLELNNVRWTEIWLRTLIGMGKIISFKIFHCRVIPREEIHRIIKEQKEAEN